MAIKTRAICAYCHRDIAVLATGEIARHGPHRDRCEGSLTVPGNTPIRTGDPLTSGEIEFLRYCWHIGDAYAAADWLDVTYAPEFLVTDDVDAELCWLINDARRFIQDQVRRRT